MSINIFCDYNKLFNADRKLYLGNKLLHIFFVLGLAYENKLNLKLPKNASINELFEINNNPIFDENIRDKKLNLAYEEESIFEIYNNSSLIKKNYLIFF